MVHSGTKIQKIWSDVKNYLKNYTSGGIETKNEKQLKLRISQMDMDEMNKYKHFHHRTY